MSKWTIQEGIGLARTLEPIAIANGYHVALGGSVLHQGVSDKDCDFIIYKRSKAEKYTNPLQVVTTLTEVGFTLPIEPEKDTSGGSDFRQVYKTEYCGRRVDFIFVLDPNK